MCIVVFGVEDGGSTFLRCGRNHLQGCTASQPRRTRYPHREDWSGNARRASGTLSASAQICNDPPIKKLKDKSSSVA
jgi:hypothetical protein